MKVLLVTDQLLQIKGKKILGSVNFTNNLKRLSKLGELYICCRDGGKSKNRILVANDNVNDYVSPKNIVFVPKSFICPSVKTISAIRSQIREVDLVVCYVPALNAEIAALMAHNMKKPVLTIMVACPWDGLWNQDWKRKIAAPYRYFLNRLVVGKASYALYVTDYFLQHRYPNHARREIGISDVVLESMEETILQRRIEKINNYSNRGIINVATTAMLNVKYKGQRFVLEALKLLKDKGITNYRYYLIGGGDNTALKELAVKLGVDSQIVFVGKISHSEVFSLLDEVDIYIHPSLQEGLPRSVVEAMSRGLPCIGSRTGAIPELLDNDFIVRRKSTEDIANKLLTFRDSGVMIQQAKRNFEKAKLFNCHRLDDIRNKFFQDVKDDICK